MLINIIKNFFFSSTGDMEGKSYTEYYNKVVYY